MPSSPPTRRRSAMRAPSPRQAVGAEPPWLLRLRTEACLPVTDATKPEDRTLAPAMSIAAAEDALLASANSRRHPSGGEAHEGGQRAAFCAVEERDATAGSRGG